MRPEDLVEYRQYYGRMDIASFLPQIQAPTLVVYPRRSEYMPMDAVRRIAALIRAAEFVDCDTEMYPFQGPDQNRNLQIIETFLDPLTETGRVGAESHTPGQVVCELSPRELQVLALIAAGKSNHDVAEELALSVSTIDRHVANVYAKTNVHNRAEATMWAAPNGVVSPPPAT
jgi:DNA-binding NarL/FixJ family response regulator